MARSLTIKARSPFWHFDWRELVEYRWVFFMLVLRDIKLRYKQTALGVVWVLLQPLITAAIFGAIFSRMMHVSSEGVPYVAFAFSGLIPWTVFSGALQRASVSLINESPLITKVYFPRIYIPTSATFGLLVDFLITLLSMFTIMVIWKIPVTANLLLLPVATILVFLLSTGLNLVIATCNVFYRDFKHIVPFLMQIWMYSSPIAYSAEMVPERYAFIYHLNPLIGAIDLFRYCFLPGQSFPLYSALYSTGMTLALCFFGFLFFRKFEHTFADVI